MENKELNPNYKVSFENGDFYIKGKEQTTGEEIFIRCIVNDDAVIKLIVGILNKEKVSVYHAKDVIRDMLMGFFD